MAVLKLDAHGADVVALQQALKAHGFDPGVPDGDFGHGTEAALIAFQKSESLTPDGVVGPQTRNKLGMPVAPSPAPAADITDKVTPTQVSRMFPQTPSATSRRTCRSFCRRCITSTSATSPCF